MSDTTTPTPTATTENSSGGGGGGGGGSSGGSKTIPKWKQLQMEQQELAKQRKREEAEAKAKKLQELSLSSDVALQTVGLKNSSSSGSNPSTPKGSAVAAAPSSSSSPLNSSGSNVPKWKQVQLENEKLAQQRKKLEQEAKAKAVASVVGDSAATNASGASAPTTTPNKQTNGSANTNNNRSASASNITTNTPTKSSATTPTVPAALQAPAIPSSSTTTTTSDTKTAATSTSNNNTNTDNNNHKSAEPEALKAPSLPTTSAADAIAQSDNNDEGKFVGTISKSEPLDGSSSLKFNSDENNRSPTATSLTNLDNGEDEVVEAAMVEVVNMYAGIDDDDEEHAEARESGSDSHSNNSGSESESEEEDGDDLKRPPKDVSDSGLVPVMPPKACESAANNVNARDIVQSPSLRLRVGYAETQGVRRSMEDRMTGSRSFIISNNSNESDFANKSAVFGRLFGCDTADYFGMFDGHGGDATAHYVGEELHNVIYEHIKKAVKAGSDDPTLNFALALDDPEALRGAMTSAFDAMQASLESRQPPLAGGAVGVAALVLGDSLFVANCGDARAVLVYENGEAKRLTLDHKPHLPAEKTRIESLGGFVTTHTSRAGVVRTSIPFAFRIFVLTLINRRHKVTSRVCGAISVARAFGDIGLQPYLIATPFVADVISVAANDASKPVALLLACDGLFDVITDEQAGKTIVEQPNPEKAAIKLRNAAYAGGSTDNISVMVVHLPAFVSKHPSQIEAQLAKAHA